MGIHLGYLFIPAKAGIQRKAVNKQPAVYILAEQEKWHALCGVTSDLLSEYGSTKITW